LGAGARREGCDGKVKQNEDAMGGGARNGRKGAYMGVDVGVELEYEY